MRDPAVAYLLVLVIGTVAGIVFDRVAGPSWLIRQFAGLRGVLTSALVGIAGAFIGYHLTLIALGATGNALIPFVGALIGAVVVLFAWRTVR